VGERVDKASVVWFVSGVEAGGGSGGVWEYLSESKIESGRMMKKSIFGELVMGAALIGGVLGMGGEVGAQAGVELKAELEVGSEYVTYTESDVTLGLPVGGASGEQTVTTEQQVTTSIRGGEGGTGKVVSVVHDFAKIELKSPMMQMTYDSRIPNQDESGIGGDLSLLIGKEIKVIYDENDEFVRVEGEGMLTEDGGSSPFGQSIGANEIREMIQSILGGQLGERTVKVGDSWQHVMEMSMPGVGKVGLDVRYLYRKDGIIDGEGCAIIDFSGMMSGEFFGDEGGVEAGDARPERRADGGLEDSRISGTLAYDKKLGVPRATEMEVKMTMKMPSPLGAESEVKIPMVQKTRSTLRSYRMLGRAPAAVEVEQE
jgi:hypothetical protein